MDAIVLTWRWHNVLIIWAMVLLLYLAITIARQIAMRVEGAKAANA